MTRFRRLVGVTAILFMASFSLASAQDSFWNNLTFDQSSDLTGVAFTTDTKGVVVGPNETIYVTSNGGLNFSLRSVIGLDGTKCCRSVKFLDSSIIWIGGKAAVLRSTNGGSSFGGTQIIGSSVDRRSIAGVSNTVAWQVENGGEFIRYTISTGGGSVSTSSWSSSRFDDLYDIHMFDSNTGIAVGERGEIVRMTAGSGDSPNFSSISSGTSSDLNAIHMLDSTTGWIAGDSGTILKTVNGGSNWSKKSSGTIQDLDDIHFRNASVGWAVGEDGVILLSLDGGETWIAESSGTTVDLFGVHATSSYTYAVGALGTFLKRERLGMLLFGAAPAEGPTGGGTVVTIDGSGFESGAMVLFGSTASQSVTFVSQSRLTAVSPQHGSGTVEITVVNPGGESVTLSNAFTYNEPPRRRPVRRPGG